MKRSELAFFSFWSRWTARMGSPDAVHFCNIFRIKLTNFVTRAPVPAASSTPQ